MYESKYDVIVVGSGPGGFPAAIAAARMGLKVLLVERSAQLGGLLVSGLPPLAFIDRAGNTVVRGIAQELIDRLKEVGGTVEHMRVPIQNSLTPISAPWTRILIFEMCKEANIDVLLYSELMSVMIDNCKIRGISVACRGTLLSFKSDIIIDATGDGCVAAFAGAKYEKSDYMQPPTITFELGNINFDAVFEYLRNHPESYKLPDGFEGIEQSMELFENIKCFPIMGFFDLIEKAKANGDFDVPRNMIDFVRQPHGNQVFVNVTRAINTDMTDIESVVNAEFKCHYQIKQTVLFLRKYVPGFENCYLVSVAPSLGARESRRVIGKKYLTTEALKNLDIPDDTIALAGYNIDIHSAKSEQMSIIPIEHAIGIPYGCLLPQSIEGLLLSGRTISVDQTIFGMTRIMSTCMAVGQACGTAAALAHKKCIMPSEIDIQELRQTLKKSDAIVDLE